MVPGALVKGVGGAMNLVSGGGRVLAVMDHVTKQGEPKLLASCPLPLTGRRVVSGVITDWRCSTWPAPPFTWSSWRPG